MSQLMQRLLYPYMAPKDDDNGGGGGDKKVDRGDDHEPVDDGNGGAGPGKKAAKDEEDDDKKGEADDAEDEDDDKKVKADDAEDEDDDKKVKADDADDDEDKDGSKKMPDTIPKARFDQLRTKSKDTIAALQSTIAELTKGVQKQTETVTVAKLEEEIEKLEADAEALQNDGKSKEASAKMRAIRVLEREINTQRASDMSKKAQATAVEQMRFDMLVEKLEKEFPQIDPDSDEYDEAQVEEIQFLRTSFEKNGMSSSKALAKAVELVFVNKVADADDGGGKKDDDAKGLRDKGQDRKQKAIDRNLKDAKKIPARGDGKGVDSDKKGGGVNAKAVPDMEEEEFNALPESKKAELRGDFV